MHCTASSFAELATKWLTFSSGGASNRARGLLAGATASRHDQTKRAQDQPASSNPVAPARRQTS